MKSFKAIAVTVVSIFFIVGLASVALSAEIAPQVQVQPKVEKAGPIVVSAPSPCPTGWHLKSGTPGKSRYTCVPDKPKPVKCPAGYTYFDNTEAGCFVGCTETIK